MALTKVNTGGLALDAVDNTILKLDDDFALTGTVTGASPAIAAGDVLQRVSTQVYTYSSGTAANWDSSGEGGGPIVETTAYNSASLTPLRSLAITAKRANSRFIIDLTGRFSINTGYRSALSLSDGYSAGTANTAGGHIIYQTHYGLYNDSGGDIWYPGSYRADDTRNISAGATRTYYWFGGSISGTQKYWALNMSITEVAT